MDKKRIVWLLISVCAGGLLFFTQPGLAADLTLTGPLTESPEPVGDIDTQGTTTVAPGVTITVEAYYTITLEPGFIADSGSEFTAEIPDDDGLSNLCELTYFGSLLYGPEDDPDNDTLTNLQECLLGYNPNETNDFDNDGLADWWELLWFGSIEIAGSTDDSDGDGLSNFLEFKFNTNPNNGDDILRIVMYYYYTAKKQLMNSVTVAGEEE